MTKKDYVVIAEVIAIYSKAFKANEESNPDYRVTGSALVREIAYKLSEVWRADNPRFDSVRFANACGV